MPMDPLQTQLFTNQDIDEKVLIYNLRIVPPEPVYSQVLDYKKEFVDRYGEHILTNSSPHITVAKFIMSATLQNVLVENFEVLSDVSKFSLKVNGFGILESNGSLVLQINNSHDFEGLLAKIARLKRALLYHKAKNFGLIYTPSITIASFLEQEVLHESLSYFKYLDYYHHFFGVDHILITSRENGKTWDWEHKINLK